MTSLLKQLKTRGTTAERTEIDVSEIFGDDGGGQKVFARQMTLADREWVMSAMRSSGAGGDTVLLPTMRARCRQIVRSVVDESGKRLMSDLDVDGLMKECRSQDVDLIGQRLDEVAGAQVSIEDAEKN